MQLNYFARPECSNSDLSALWYELIDREYFHNVEAAYKFGRLVDILITEPELANHFKRTIISSEGLEHFTEEDWDCGLKMRIAYLTDEYCQNLNKVMVGQVIKTNDLEIEYKSFKFKLPARCKYDLFSEPLRFGGDIKSTTAKTDKEFLAACYYFGYPRQRAWYMDISGSDKDILIGISKTNYKIFKIFINRGDQFYNDGKADYQKLAFKYWQLEHSFN